VKRLITRESALATSSLRDELLSILERGVAAPGAPGAGGPGQRRMPLAQGVR
jgi:hypothetical protein